MVGQTSGKNPVGIEEASRHFGVSSRTIRRWIQKGKLPAQKLSKGEGYVYLVDISGQSPVQMSIQEGRENVSGVGSVSGEFMVSNVSNTLSEKDKLIELLRDEIAEKNRQIGEILLVLRQTQALLPPAQKKRRWWWPFGQK